MRWRARPSPPRAARAPAATKSWWWTATRWCGCASPPPRTARCGGWQTPATTRTGEPPWGLAVHWALGALVDDAVTEYILWPEHVEAAVRAAGLRVVETHNFHEFAYLHRVPQNGLSEDEWAVSRLYRTLVVARAPPPQ